MLRLTRLAAAAVFLLGATACDHPVRSEAAAYRLPEPDQSLDPAALVIGEYIATPCGNNEPLLSRPEWAVVDIFFGRRSERDPVTGPRQEHLRAVSGRGGIVLHRFNVPAVRAYIQLSRIPDLVASEFWVSVRAVPNPRRYDLDVLVGFVTPLRESDLEQFQRLGGRITTRFSFIDAIGGVLPDRSIPALRASDRTRYVEPNGIACLAPAAPPQAKQAGLILPPRDPVLAPRPG